LSSIIKKKQKRKTAKERDSEKVIKCLQSRLAWCNHTGQKFDAEKEQYSIIPRALADENGVQLQKVFGQRNLEKDTETQITKYLVMSC
jgi:hypothetical protein